MKISGIILLLTAYLFLTASIGPAMVSLAASKDTDASNVPLFLPLLAHQSGEAVALPLPSWGAPIAISPRDGSVWVVNPDAGSLTRVNADTLTRDIEIPTGGEPWSLAFAPDGATLYVVDRAGGLLVVVNALDPSVVTTFALGPEPGAIALSPSGKTAYVSLTAANAIAVIDTQAHTLTSQITITSQIEVGPLPYAVAVSNDGDNDDHDEQIYVSHLVALPRSGTAEATDDGREGRVTVIDAKSHTIHKEIALLPDAHGFPNLLTSITLSGKWAWIPQVRSAPALPNGLTTTVFAAVSALDRAQGIEDRKAHLALNDEEVFGSPVNNPVAAIPSPDGKTLYIVLAGSNLVEVVDITDPYQPRLVKFLPTGHNPRGMAVSDDGRTGYVMSYLSRSVTVLDLVQNAVVTDVTVTNETLDAQVLRGKVLFNTAVDPRMARASWTSCASCHPDAGSDGVTWIFPDGPRQTPALWNSARTLPWHWSAALDEPHDVEDTIQIIQQGIGLATGADPLLLGEPLQGRSNDLDALAAFLMQGIRTPHAPPPTSGHDQGRRLFISAGCATCHGGEEWTTSALPGPAGTLDADGNGMVDVVLRDVGTFTTGDLRGATGFDVPSLIGVGLTAPYLHDGSMPTLDALLRSGHPTPGILRDEFTGEAVEILANFLRSIDADTPPVLTQP